MDKPHTDNKVPADMQGIMDNPLYHNTYKLLKSYRDVIWSLELSIQELRHSFRMEFDENLEDFIETLELAGADLSGTNIESHARTIDRSRKMIKIIDSAIELLRSKHKFGEIYYWVLYYTYISPQQLEGIQDILEKLKPHMKNNSYRSYYRRRNEAIEALSSVLWGYTAKDCKDIVERFFPEG